MTRMTLSGRVSMTPARSVAVLPALFFASGAAGLECSLNDADAVREAGAQTLGQVTFEQGRDGDAVRLEKGAALHWPTAGNFDPKSGTLEMWVKPLWRGDEPRRRSFLHFGDSNSHCTLFRTERGTVRFVYKASPEAYVAADLPVTSWTAGEWHHLVASWAAARGEQMWISLKVDEAERVRMGGKQITQLPERFFLGRRGGDIEHANALLDEFRLVTEAESLPYPAGPKAPLDVKIDAGKPTGEFRRIHDFVTLWNSKDNPLPFRVGDPYFRRLTDAQFRLVRLVAFSENWLWGVGLSRDEAGKLQIDWTDFDNLLDLVKAAGAEPYIRLAYHTPKILVKEPPKDGHWSYAMPSDLDEWSDLMYQIVKHCNLDRKLGIKYWVASLNEGDITAGRGQSDWRTVCELYERTVKAALRADPSIKVGGPAMARSTDGKYGVWFREFIRFCRERKLPLDFLCTHAYHRAHPREFEEHVDTVKAMVRDEWPGLKPEYFIDEFNQWSRTKNADNEYGAAYMAAALHYQRRAGLDKSCVVSFNHFHALQEPGKVYEQHTGPFDKTDQQSARFLAQKLECEGIERDGLLMHPPRERRAYTFGDYRLTVPADDTARVEFSTGLPLEYPGMDGVTFKLIAHPGPEQRVLFSEWQRTRAWKQRRVSLKEFAGKMIALRWAVDSGPNASGVADWAALGEPAVVVGTEDAPAVVFDFAEHVAEAKTGVASDGYRFEYNDDAIRRYVGLPLIKGTVVTAPYFVYLMHSMMKSQALTVDLDGEAGIATDDSTGVLASRDESGVTILAWRFDLMDDSARKITLNLSGLADAGRLSLKRYLIDATHTNPYHTYVVKGEPSPDGKYNLETGKLDIVEERSLTVAEGTCQLELALPNMSVSLLELAL